MPAETINNTHHRWMGELFKIFLLMLILTSCADSTQSQAKVRVTASDWAILQQRALFLPGMVPGSVCHPTQGQKVNPSFGPALGSGPVYAVGMGTDGILSYADTQHFGSGADTQGWGGQKVLWIVNSSYRGPVLIRGQQLDGPQALRFNGGLDQKQFTGDWATAALLTQLRLIGDAQSDSSWSNWSTYTRLRDPGCYAYQVDGLTFHETILFQVTTSHISRAGGFWNDAT